MTYLLDINVLIALFDPAHVHHEPTHRWFQATGQASWATCPLTENGFVRVVSNLAYPTMRFNPAEAAEYLRLFCTRQGHHFWADSITLMDAARFDLSQLSGHQQISDLYLAALARENGGMLATLDTRIPVAALVGPPQPVIELIPVA